jgi:hypothetical protein
VLWHGLSTVVDGAGTKAEVEARQIS